MTVSNKYLIFMLMLIVASSTKSDDDTNTDKELKDYSFYEEPQEIPFDENRGEYYLEDGDFFQGFEEYGDRDPEDDRKVLKPMDTALAAIYGTITIVGLIFNGVVFFVICGRNEISKTVTAIYVIQLAFADSIFLFSLPIFSMQKVTGSWSFGAATCIICQGIKFLNYYAGIFFLTAMSVDRYIAVAYSSRAHQLRTALRTILVSVIVWLLSSTMAFPTAFYSGIEDISGTKFCRLQFPGYEAFNSNDTYVFVFLDEEYRQYSGEMTSSYEYYETEEFSASNGSSQFKQDNHTDIEINEDLEKLINSNVDDYKCAHDSSYASYNSWLIANFVMGFLIPFLVITISYILILLRLRTSEEKIANMTGKRTLNMRKRVTRMVAALVICFAICWLPYHVFLLAKIKGLNVRATTCDAMEQFLIALGFANSAINPILYTFMGHNFKQRIRESINHTKRKLRRGSIASGSGHITRNNSDHGNISLTKRIGNMVGLRRTSKPSSGGEANSSNDRNSKNLHSGKKMKYGIPLLDLHKKKEQKSAWNYESEQIDRTECMSRSQSNQTECTRVMLDRDAKSDGPDVFVR